MANRRRILTRLVKRSVTATIRCDLASFHGPSNTSSHANRDPFADRSQRDNSLPLHRLDQRLERVQEKRIRQPHAFERLIENPPRECFDVDRDVGQFGHGLELNVAVPSTQSHYRTRRIGNHSSPRDTNVHASDFNRSTFCRFIA
jgi:hypothetical protein